VQALNSPLIALKVAENKAWWHYWFAQFSATLVRIEALHRETGFHYPLQIINPESVKNAYQWKSPFHWKY